MWSLRTFLIAAAVVSSLSVSAAAKSGTDTISVTRAFVDMQVGDLDMIKKSTRMDMLDYFAVDSVYKATNTMDGESWLLEVKPDFLSVRLTPVTDLQLKTLDYKKGNIVASVYTIGEADQAPDSDLKFFDGDMNELPRDKFFKLPDLKDFFDIPKGSEVTMKDIERVVPFPTITYTLEPGSNDMTARLTVGVYMGKDEKALMEKYLKPSVTYIWNGKQFKIKK